MGALDWVFGWRTLRFSLPDRTAVFDLAYRAGIRLGRERFRGGEVLLRAGAGDALLLSRLAEERGISVALSEIRGLPAAFRFCLRRPGIAMGLLAGAVFLAWSSGVVWDIRIEGNTETSDEAILNQLEELGFKVSVSVYDPGQDFVVNVITTRSYDLLLYEIELGADPDILAYYHSSQATQSGLNLSNYNNPLADDLILAARETVDDELRSAKYVSFLQHWIEDVPAIGVYQVNISYFFDKNSKTFSEDNSLATAIDRFNDVEYWAIEKTIKNRTP